MADEPVTPTPPDLAGYPTADELARGYRNSSAEAKRLAAENQRLQEQLQGLAANPRPDIPQRGRPEDQLRDYGIPVDVMEQFVNERVGQALAPLARGFEARGKVLQDYPDYNKFEAEVAQFINSDPDLSQRYARMFTADPAGAMELAFLKYGESKRRSAPAGSPPNPQEIVDASLPGGRPGESRRVGSGEESDVQEAWAQFQKTGSPRDVEAFVKARLRQVIPDSHFQ